MTKKQQNKTKLGRKKNSYRRSTEETEITEVKEKRRKVQRARNRKQGQHRSNAYMTRSQRTEGARNVSN